MKKVWSCLAGFLAVIMIAGCSNFEDGSRGDSSGGDNNSQNNSSLSFSHCTVSGSKFESRFLGIGADLGEGWRFANDEELANSNGLEELTDESLKEALKTKNFICDMIAQRSFEGGADSITLTYPNITAITAAEGADMSELEYAQATLVGIDSATAVIETVNLGDEKHSSIRLIGKTGGRDYYQRMIFVEKNGYIGMITLTFLSEQDIKDIISRFYTL